MAEAESTNIQSAGETLQIIRGLPMSSLLFKKENIEEIFDYMPLDGDVIIATYPKTGTTWMQYIVIQILSNGESFPSFDDSLYKVTPYLELFGTSILESLTTKPRVYRHHLPYNYVKRNCKTKIIYVYRKPEDTFVSYYHFLLAFHASIEFDDLFECFVDGKISYGLYFDHVLSYLKHKEDGNILFVSYEKLLVHTKKEILRVAKFLGEEYFNTLVNNESVLDKILQNTSFDHMKKNLSLLIPQRINQPDTKDIPLKEINFFRKGVIGDGKDSLSSEQLRRIKKLAEEKMKGTDIFKKWYTANESGEKELKCFI